MSSTINADTTNGVVITSDTSGEIELQSNGVTKAKITSSGLQNASGGAITSQAGNNLIINGDMRIAQRGTSVAGVTSGGYLTIDRFVTTINSAGTWTQTQDTDVPTGQGFSNSLKLQCTTADTSLTSSDQVGIDTRLEAQNLQHLKFGTASAEYLTLSFWVKSNKTGTYTLEYQSHGATTRSISKSYTIDSANTWEKKIITIEGDTSGAFFNTNGLGLICKWWLAAASYWTSGTFNTSWSARINDNVVSSSNVNLADSTSNYINITGVQLEVGTVATSFEHLQYGQQLARCQRYFQTYTQPPLRGVINTTSSFARAAMVLPVSMRAAPNAVAGSLKVFDGVATNTVSSINASYNTIHKVEFDFNLASAVMTIGRAGVIYQSGSSTLTLSAEL